MKGIKIEIFLKKWNYLGYLIIKYPKPNQLVMEIN